jgi:hypothetical protein
MAVVQDKTAIFLDDPQTLGRAIGIGIQDSQGRLLLLGDDLLGITHNRVVGYGRPGVTPYRFVRPGIHRRRGGGTVIAFDGISPAGGDFGRWLIRPPL